MLAARAGEAANVIEGTAEPVALPAPRRSPSLLPRPSRATEPLEDRARRRVAVQINKSRVGLRVMPPDVHTDICRAPPPARNNQIVAADAIFTAARR
jgi:hypothetical protein